jgi:hypothetical protein
VKLLKYLALILLCFLLFISLEVFGFAFLVKSTALSPDFIASELDRLDMHAVAEEFADTETSSEMQELNEKIIENIPFIEPLVKEKTSSAIYSIYDYLLGETKIDLALILKDTYFNTSFVSSVLDNVDISSLVGVFLNQQFAGEIPIKIANLDKYIAAAVNEAEPLIKERIVAATDPVFKYLLMESHTLDASISLADIKEILRRNLLQTFLESPPPELSKVPRSTRESYFNQFYQDFSEEVPSTFHLDGSIISADVPENFNSALTEVEESLELARQYVGYFQLGFILLIVFMVLIILAIILIMRQVKSVTRLLGILLFVYGAIEYVGVWIARYLINGKISFPDLPTHLETWLLQLINNALHPLAILSLGLLICGIILIVVSFIYRQGQDQLTPTEDD